jgi:hypothetical protein
MNRSKLYLFLSIACIAGYAWIAYLLSKASSLSEQPRVCLFKHFTGIPCPSCGSTRSILCLAHGDFLGAMMWNPFGFILSIILITFPLWILFDIILKKESLLKFYRNAEKILKNKLVAVPAILLVLINWIWNIYKGL